jgi:transcriptional regulator with XRE-family HTH domain
MLPIIDLAATGKNIERLRKEKNISVRQLQEVFGFSTPQAVYKWQHGDNLPTVDNLLVLSMLFGKKMDEILVLEDGDLIHFLYSGFFFAIPQTA